MINTTEILTLRALNVVKNVNNYLPLVGIYVSNINLIFGKLNQPNPENGKIAAYTLFEELTDELLEIITESRYYENIINTSLQTIFIDLELIFEIQGSEYFEIGLNHYYLHEFRHVYQHMLQLYDFNHNIDIDYDDLPWEKDAEGFAIMNRSRIAMTPFIIL